MSIYIIYYTCRVL